MAFSHSYALSGSAYEPLLAWGGLATFGFVGVWIFFILSGFLIASSLDRNRGMLAYAESRFLRIMPALAVVVLLSALLLGPLVTTRSLTSYFSDPQTRQYIFRNLLLDIKFYLPGVFDGNPRQGVNGSLWTLHFEVYMYVVIAVVYWLKIGAQRGLFNLLMVVMFMLQFKDPPGSWLVPPAWDFQMKMAVMSFVVGAFFYNNRGSIPASAPGVFLLALFCYSVRHSASFPLILSISLAYGSLVLAYHPRLQGRWSLIENDYSYGVFLSCFPIQQTLVQIFTPLHPLAPLELFALALPLSLGYAALSWHFIEKPCLSLKARLSRMLRQLGSASPLSKQA